MNKNFNRVRKDTENMEIELEILNLEKQKKLFSLQRDCMAGVSKDFFNSSPIQEEVDILGTQPGQFEIRKAEFSQNKEKDYCQ